MMNSKVCICTSNSKYDNGECAGGYREVHKIDFLSSADHLIATVDSIIKNNLLYGCDDTTFLEDVTVYCEDSEVVKAVNSHYNGYCGRVMVYAETEVFKM